jgi:hypothetical protein
MRLTKAQGLWCSTLFVVTFGVTSALVAPPKPIRAQAPRLPQVRCKPGQPTFQTRVSTTAAVISGEVKCVAGGNVPCSVQYGVDVYQYDFAVSQWVPYLPGGGMQQQILCGGSNSYGWGVSFVNLAPAELYKIEMIINRWDDPTGTWTLLDFHNAEFYVP